MDKKLDISVGCLGAGVLGSAIIKRLGDTVERVYAWNRDSAKLEGLISENIRACASPREVASETDFIITCVTDGDAVEHIVFGNDGVIGADVSGKVLIDMSTGAVAKTREMAERFQTEAQASWLDAPISGGAPAAREGRMTVMVGGSSVAFKQASPVWDCLAGKVTLMGPQGAGQATKMINQLLVSSGLVMLAEACGLAERLGVDTQLIPDALSGGRADSAQLQEMFPKMATSEFSITAHSQIMLKDLNLIRQLAEQHSISTPVSDLTREMFSLMVERGLGDHDTSELINFYREKGWSLKSTS